MTWKRLAWAVLFSPVLIGLILFVGIFIVWKLPMFCCERLRAVRYLPLAGLIYYGTAIPFAAVALNLAWWEVLLLAGFAVLGGDWLLPDLVSFFANPDKRRAVVRAVEFVESQEGPGVHYGMVAQVGVEIGRRIVSVAIKSGGRPPACRFLAVADNGSVEELGFEYVNNHYKVSRT